MPIYDPDRLRSGYEEDDPETRPPGAIRRMFMSLIVGAFAGALLGESIIVATVVWIVVWVAAELRWRRSA